MINTDDELQLRAGMQDPNIPKLCQSASGDAFNTCQKLDANKDGRVNTSDVLVIRSYTQDADTLKICRENPTDAFAQCRFMDVTGDGVLTSLDEITIRSYIENTTAQKICAYVSDPATKAKCQSYDLDKNGYINELDTATLRTYVTTPNTLRICRATSSSSSSSIPSKCINPFSTDLMTDLNYQIDSRINDIQASATTYNVWEKREATTIGWKRSKTVWTARGEKPLDLTGISPWNSQGTFRQAGTLISPRHIVFADHYQIAIGKQIGFVDKDNNFVTRTLVAKQKVPGSDGMVGLLDSDVPSSIAYYPIISEEDMYAYFKPLQPGMIVPSLTKILMFNQKDRAIVSELFQIGADKAIYAPYRITMNNLDGSQSIKYGPAPKMIRPMMHFDSFETPIITGDSGDSVFLVINNRLALLSTHHSPSSGPLYGGLIDEINQIMKDMGAGYQVTKFDLSCFTKY